MPRRLQSILAIVAGFVLILALNVCAGRMVTAWVHASFPKTGPSHFSLFRWLRAASEAAGFMFMVAGGYLTARLAPRRPLRHAIELGVLSQIIDAIFLLWLWLKFPSLLHGALLGSFLTDLALVLPAVWLGGKWREHQLSPA